MKLSEGIELYVEHKRANGYIYKKTPLRLLAVCNRMGDVELSAITVEDISRFLEHSPASAITWRKNYQFLRQFFEYWTFHGALPHQLLMPPSKPFVRQTFVPHVYSKAQLRTLFGATSQCQENPYCRIDRRTLRTFLLFLYGTGVRLGDALALNREDIDQDTGMLTVRRQKFDRFRQIPLNPDLLQALRRYLRWRAAKHIEGNHLFVTNRGEPFSESTIAKTFQRLRRVAGVTRCDGAQPRMQDLRHTFAVHRITAWIRKGVSLDRMLPALAAYMGQVGLESAERYLSMTPERFRNQLHELSSARMKKHWRDDKELMTFLNAL